MPGRRLARLCGFALLLAVDPLRADCELRYAPSELRAKALAFHDANESRRAAEPKPVRALRPPPRPDLASPAARPPTAKHRTPARAARNDPPP